MTGRNGLVLFVGIGCILSSIASAQQPDTVLYFPDSLGYCYYPAAVVHNPLTGRVYVANGGAAGGVLVFDPATRTKTRFLRGFYYCGAFVPGVNKLYLGGDYEMAVFDAAADTLLRVIDVLTDVGGLVYSPVSAKLYLVPISDEWISYDPAGDTMIMQITDLGAATSPVWDSATNRIYAAWYDEGMVQALDCYGDTVVQEVSVSDEWYAVDLALNPANRRLYCAIEDTVYVIDADSFRVVNAIGGLSAPLAYSAALDRLYGAWSDSVVVVDCSNDSVRARVPADHVSDLRSNSATGRMYATLPSVNRIVALDAGDSIVAVVELDSVGTPQATVFSAERNELYSAMLVDNVALVDGRADTLSGVMDYAQFIVSGMAHASVGNKLYLLFPDRDTVLVIDRDYRQVAAIPVPMVETAVFPVYNPGLNRLYVADAARLWVIDCTADTLVGERSLGSFDRANTAVLVQQLGKLYVFPKYTPYDARVYDCLRDTVVATIPLTARVTSAAYHPWSNQVYASMYAYQDSTITVIDPTGDSVVKRLWGGRRSSSNKLLANDVNGLLYHSSVANEHLYVIDVRANLLVDSIELPDDGDTMFWYQRTNKLYLCDRSASQGVTVYDCDSRSVVSYLPLACGYAGALDEASERLYLGDHGQVNVLDCRTDSVVATYPIPDAPRFSLVNPIDNRVYFAERSNWVAAFQDQLAVEEGSGHEPAVYFRVVSNPVRGRAYFRCQVPVGQTAEFSAFDAAGRLVKRMEVVGRNGVLSLAWDRRDETGLRVANGVYFCRLATKARRAVTKVVLK